MESREAPSVVAFSILAGLALTLAAPRDAAAQAQSCAWYADTAIKQQQQNWAPVFVIAV